MSAAVIEAAPGTLWLAPGEEADDRRRKRRRYALLDACSAQQSGVSGIAQVAALDEYFGDSGEIEPGEIGAENDAIVAVIVACRHRGVGEDGGPDEAAEPHGGADDLVVRAIRAGLQHGKAAARGRAAVCVNVDRDVGAGPVDDLSPAVHARP